MVEITGKSEAAEIQLQGTLGTCLWAKEVIEEYRKNGRSNGPSCGWGEGRMWEKLKKIKKKSEGTHWQEWGKQEKRGRKLRGSKRHRELRRHQEGDAVIWSRETGETCWRRLPEIANEMDEMGEKGRGAGSWVSQLREDTFLPSTKRGSWTGRVRKLSSGNKNKRDSVSFTFLLTGNRKISGKVLHKVKHLCACECCLWVWTQGHQRHLQWGWFSLFETLCR